MRICVKRYLYRSRVIEQLVEDWKTGQFHATAPTFLAAIVAECIDVGALCQQTWEYVHELLDTDPNGDAIDAAAKVMKPELPRTLAAFEWVKGLVGTLKSSPIKDAAEFDAAVDRVRDVSAKIEMVFPALNEAMAEASRAAFLRGECIPIEDLIRDTQGSSVPVH